MRGVAIYIFLAVAVSYISAVEFVERYTTSKAYDRCIERIFSTQDLLVCMRKELALQDKILNENYKKAIRRVDKKRRKKLIRMQRSWIDFRDKKCSFFYDEKSGSGGLLDQEECFIKETIRRSNELAEIF